MDKVDQVDRSRLNRDGTGIQLGHLQEAINHPPRRSLALLIARRNSCRSSRAIRCSWRRRVAAYPLIDDNGLRNSWLTVAMSSDLSNSISRSAWRLVLVSSSRTCLASSILTITAPATSATRGRTARHFSTAAMQSLIFLPVQRSTRRAYKGKSAWFSVAATGRSTLPSRREP